MNVTNVSHLLALNHSVYTGTDQLCSKLHRQFNPRHSLLLYGDTLLFCGEVAVCFILSNTIMVAWYFNILVCIVYNLYSLGVIFIQCYVLQ